MAYDVTSLLTEGLEHYLNGRLREAASAWEAALRVDPNNKRAQEYLRSALSTHGPLRAGRELGQHPPTERATPPPAYPAHGGPTAWDDGPSASRSITMDDSPHVPGLNETPLLDDSPGDAQQEEIDRLMRGSRELYALNDFSGALELLEKVHELAPNRADADQMREDCTETLIHMFESQLGSLEGVPVLAVNPDEIIWLNLDHRAGFVLAQIDGVVTFDDLYSICGMSRLDTARILAQLKSEKVIKTVR